MMTRYSLLPALAAIILAGCVVAPGGQHDRQPQSSVHGPERVFNVPPPPVGPPPQFDQPRPHQPSPAYVWLDGYWDWDGARYFWQPGRWVVAPQGLVWEGPRWVHRSNRGWVLIEGVWRKANTESSN